MMVGELLDERYELREILGEGAMGTVFIANQISVNRDVAIKVMKDEMFQDYGMIRRFKLEMEIISNLQHPNIVRLLDTGHDKRLGALFLVMEYIEGISLGELFYDRPDAIAFHPGFAIEIAIQLCSALTEPHQLGVIHRDIKPDNIILTVQSDEQLAIKLLDFGVARVVDPHEKIDSAAARARLTATGGIVGTPPYIAPELCEGSFNASAKADLYAIGALLFELLTGRPPFEGRSTAEVFYKHVHEPPPRLLESTDLPDCQNEDLETLLLDLLAKNPDERPASALEVKKRLETIRRQRNLYPPSLTYNPGAPEPGAFDEYVISLENNTFGTLEEFPPAMLPGPPTTPPPLPGVRRTTDSHPDLGAAALFTPVPASHNTSEIPVAQGAADTFSLPDDDELFTLSTSRKRTSPAVLVGAALGALLILAILAFALTSDEEPDEIASTTTTPLEHDPQPEPSSPEPPTRREPPSPRASLSPSILAAQQQLHPAISASLEAARKQASERPSNPSRKNADSTRKTRPASPSKPAPSPPQKPDKLKNKIDWLYNN